MFTINDNMHDNIEDIKTLLESLVNRSYDLDTLLKGIQYVEGHITAGPEWAPAQWVVSKEARKILSKYNKT